MKRYNSSPLSKITDNYVEKSINGMLIDLLGEPGKSAGKAEPKGGAYEASMGYNTPSAYDYISAQRDAAYQNAFGESSNGPAQGMDWAAQGIGLIRDIIGYGYSAWSAKKAYQRQNEYYDNHLSMPAKVAEYEAAGLNPYGLAGAGVGATSAPSVAQAQTPSADGAVSVLTALLDYKAKMKQISVEEKRVGIEQEKLPAMLEQMFTTAEKNRANTEWYGVATQKATEEVSLVKANVAKVFADAEKVSAEAFILEIQGQYADATAKANLENLLKDLNVKDAQISKTDAETAVAWTTANLNGIIAKYQGALMAAQTQSAKASAVDAFARGALTEFERNYKETHNGSEAPKGTYAAVISMCSEAANRITNGLGKVVDKLK